jgi:4,5-DOPA dioxygenase extradiol
MTPDKERMPALFVGHGSPMNAITKTIFSDGIENIARRLPQPEAILCVSAHWETRGTFVTAMEHPKTLHDFGGFPRQLYEVQYPAQGSPALAKRVRELITSTTVELNDDWGLDHGCWSVMKYLFPHADVPIVELSLDYTQSALFHYALGKELSALRDEGVMVVASGNLIHNLRMIDWAKLDMPDTGYDWAEKVHVQMVEMIRNDDHPSLIGYDKRGRDYRYAIPTPDHFLPLLCVLAMKEKGEKPVFFNESIVGGSLDMTSLIVR